MDGRAARRLQRLHRGLPAADDLPQAGAAGAGGTGRGLPADRAAGLAPTAGRALGAHTIGAYRHLMQRVDAGTVDALLEAAARRSRPPASAWAAKQHRARDQDRRLRQGRPAHRRRSSPPSGRRLDKLLRLTLDVGEGAHAQRLRGIKAAYQPARPGRQADRRRRQPRAAQDEVRRQRGHGARRQPCRREDCSPACTSSNRCPAPCRACACADRPTRGRVLTLPRATRRVAVTKRARPSSWRHAAVTPGTSAYRRLRASSTTADASHRAPRHEGSSLSPDQCD